MKKYILIPFLLVLFSCSTEAKVVLPQPNTEQEEYLFSFVQPYVTEDNRIWWTKKIDSDWAELIFLNKVYDVRYFPRDHVDFNLYSLEELYYLESLLNDYQDELINPIADCLVLDSFNKGLSCPFVEFTWTSHYFSDFTSRHGENYNIYLPSNQSVLDWYLDYSRWVCDTISDDSFDVQAFVYRLFFNSFTSNEQFYKDNLNIERMITKSAIQHMCSENKIKFYSAITDLPQN